MKSKIFALCYLVLTILSTLKGQEQSQTFSPLGIRTVLNVSTFTDYPYSPNPIGTDTSRSPRTYRVGASFDISSILNYVYITRAELIIDLRVRLGGSEVSIKKLSQNVNNYSDASTFWNEIGSGSLYRSGVSPTGGGQTLSFASTDAFVEDIRNALTGNDIVSIGFMSELGGNRNTLNNLYSVSLKVYYKNPGVIVKNDFEGVGTGQLKVDGITYNSPVEFNWPPSEIHSAEAIDNQTYNDFTWRFKRWEKNDYGSDPSYQLTRSISSTPNRETTTFTAVFRRILNITVQNNFDRRGNGGEIKVNGANRNSPFSFQVTSDTTFTIEAITPTTFNGVPYEFVNWSDGNTSNPRTVTPTGHTTYTANFRVPPPPTPTNLVITNAGQANQSPNLSWQYPSPPSDFSHFNVYRRHWDELRGWYSDWELLASPTQTSYTDWSEVIDPSSMVYAYYHVTAVNIWGAQSNQSNWVNTKVFGPPTRLSDSKEPMKATLGISALPDRFALGQNYPNPFNPQTEISFALPELSNVRLTVMDVLGREVAILADHTLPAGYRTVRWNGRNSKGESLSSGLYFYRFTAVGESGKTFTQTMKMLMTK